MRDGKRRGATPSVDPPPEPAPAPGQAARVTCYLFAGLLCFYALLCNRQVCYGDAPELMTAASRLGVAHPSGYPLFTMLGKLASLMPLGPLPYRMGLVAGLFGALAAACVCRLAFESRCSRGPAVLAGLAFGLSPVVWGNATVFEVYTLNAVLVGAALLLSARVWDRAERERSERDRDLRWLALVVGLGLSHHLTYVCVLPAVGWALIRGRRTYLPTIGALLRAMACLLLGCSPWLYFVVRGRFAYDPATCWAEVDTLRAVLRHITAREYGAHPFAFSASAAPRLAARDFVAFWEQFGPLLALAPLGLRGLRRTHPALFDIVVGLLVTNGVMVFGAHGGYTEFFIPSYVCVAVLAALGLGWCCRLPALRRPAQLRRLPLAIAVVILLWAQPDHFATLRPLRAPLAMHYVDRAERELPPDAVVIYSSYWKYPDHLILPLRYAQGVGRRLPRVVLGVNQFSDTGQLTRFLSDVGAAPDLLGDLLRLPAPERPEQFIRRYTGPRPLFTDAPFLIERCGKGGALRGFYWRIADQTGFTLETDLAADLAWVREQLATAGRYDDEQACVATVLLNQIEYQLRTGHPVEAHEAALELGRLCKDADGALFFAATYLSRLGAQPDAWGVWRRLQELLPYAAITYSLKGMLLFKERSYRETLDALDQGYALDHVAERGQVAYLRAMCYVALGDRARAEAAAGPQIWESIRRELQGRAGRPTP
ncbi:MAG: DUF2723 domain-containing protein [Armatimonadetes bacterium]|nr:DUF2723 domain-containing protein [Armatimonadota bacterium]